MKPNTNESQYKVWLKPSAEMSFLYGNNVIKSGLARITESTPQYAGVVVYNLADIPLGFGVAAQTTEACKELDPTANVVLHQADVGEFLRGLEEDMF
jgi:60S ribosome subunit biogenesis protein NIP7